MTVFVYVNISKPVGDPDHMNWWRLRSMKGRCDGPSGFLIRSRPHSSRSLHGSVLDHSNSMNCRCYISGRSATAPPLSR
jgi:hypothetical protein